MKLRTALLPLLLVILAVGDADARRNRRMGGSRYVSNGTFGLGLELGAQRQVLPVGQRRAELRPRRQRLLPRSRRPPPLHRLPLAPDLAREPARVPAPVLHRHRRPAVGLRRRSQRCRGVRPPHPARDRVRLQQRPARHLHPAHADPGLLPGLRGRHGLLVRFLRRYPLLVQLSAGAAVRGDARGRPTMTPT